MGVLDEHPNSVPVVDPYWSGTLDLDEAERVVARSMLAGVVAYGDFSGRPAGNDPDALRAVGVRSILTLGVDDAPESIAAAIRDAVGEPEIREVVDRVTAALPWEQQMMVRWAVRNGWRPVTVGELAEGLGVTPRTLRRWCAAHPGLSPRTLLSWSRLLHACRLISHTHLSPGAAARVLGFSSQSDLYRKYERLVGRRFSDESRETLFGLVAERFVEVVAGRVG